MRFGMRDVKLSSPRAWGCFFIDCWSPCFSLVFPTGVGMFPKYTSLLTFPISLPHGRGDVSVYPSPRRFEQGSSPRAWGCFYACYRRARALAVFPTGVGMFLGRYDCAQRLLSLPHGRGDVSDCYGIRRLCPMSSPRAWGCFRVFRPLSRGREVFPTGVGMFLMKKFLFSTLEGLPHGRGDVSN